MTERQFLTATDLARLCEVDLKTIHNWCEREGALALPHFRTPGRHLRFRREEIDAWLVARGFKPSNEKTPSNDERTTNV